MGEVSKAIGFAALLLWSCSEASAQVQLICLGEKAVGFKWSGGQWASATFSVADDKFLVSEVAPMKIGDETFTFEVKKFGREQPVFRCSRPGGGNRLTCGGLGYGMLIDMGTMRYQELYGLGYINGNDKDGNTPSLTIGTCARAK